MTLIASARSTPGLLKQDVLVDGRFHLVTDEPERLGGTDTGPSPHELLVAALASCTATAVAAYVRTKEWATSDMMGSLAVSKKAARSDMKTPNQKLQQV